MKNTSCGTREEIGKKLDQKSWQPWNLVAWLPMPLVYRHKPLINLVRSRFTHILGPGCIQYIEQSPSKKN
jgi:hypothetical protein